MGLTEKKAKKQGIEYKKGVTLSCPQKSGWFNKRPYAAEKGISFL